MTIKEQATFLYTLHRGAVNLTLHVLSIPIIVVGLSLRRASLIALGGLLEVTGHAYNYTLKFDPEQRRKAKTVLPLQLLLSVAVFVLLLKWFKWF